MRFDLTDLHLFLAVANAGSITRGAQDVGLSLAAASDRLREMELAGGVLLLERGRRGVRLTEAGETLSHHARQIIGHVSMMRADLGKFAKRLRATIRMAVNTAAMVDTLPQRLTPWLADHPQVDVDLQERQSREIARSVTAGFADIGILSDAASHELLLLKPFATSQLVVISASSHRLARESQVRFDSLTENDFIGLKDGALQGHIEAQAEKIGARLHYRISLRTYESICHAASAGLGIAIVPSTVAQLGKRSHPLSITPLADAWARRNLVVCIAKNADPPPLVRDLFEHLSA